MVVSLSPSSYSVCVMSVLFTAVALVVGDSVCVSSESRIINQSQLSHKSCCISLNLSGWSLRSAVYEASACFSVDSGQRPSGAVIIPEEQSGICGIWSRLLLHVVSDHFDNWTQSELIVQWTQSHLYDKEIKDSLSSCGHFSFFFWRVVQRQDTCHRSLTFMDFLFGFFGFLNILGQCQLITCWLMSNKVKSPWHRLSSTEYSPGLFSTV